MSQKISDLLVKAAIEDNELLLCAAGGRNYAIQPSQLRDYTMQGLGDELQGIRDAFDGPHRWTSTMGGLQPIAGGYLYVYGGSIARGVISTGAGIVTDMDNAWPAKLASALGWDTSRTANRCVSGATLSGADSYMVRQKIIAEVTDSATPKVVVIAAGVNDWDQGIPLGSYGDASGAGTFYGGVRAICEHLAALESVKRVVFVTPIPCHRAAQAAVAPLDAYREAIYKIATEHGFEVVSGLSLGMPTEADEWGLAMMPDGLHPSAAGRDLLARSIIGKLR